MHAWKTSLVVSVWSLGKSEGGFLKIFHLGVWPISFQPIVMNLVTRRDSTKTFNKPPSGANSSISEAWLGVRSNQL